MVKKSKTLEFNRGSIFVFEGDDQVGKSTLCQKTLHVLKEQQIKVKIIHFPGKNTKTLGGKIYKIHHNKIGKKIPAISLQMLHVAAHIDTWQNKIEKLLQCGYIVLMDRFWWSTYAYGKLQQIDDFDLYSIIGIEQKYYQENDIKHYFYIKNSIRKPKSEVEKFYFELINKDNEYTSKTTIVDNNFNDNSGFEIIKNKVFKSIEI